MRCQCKLHASNSPLSHVTDIDVLCSLHLRERLKENRPIIQLWWISVLTTPPPLGRLSERIYFLRDQHFCLTVLPKQNGTKTNKKKLENDPIMSIKLFFCLYIFLGLYILSSYQLASVTEECLSNDFLSFCCSNNFLWEKPYPWIKTFFLWQKLFFCDRNVFLWQILEQKLVFWRNLLPWLKFCLFVKNLLFRTFCTCFLGISFSDNFCYLG